MDNKLGEFIKKKRGGKSLREFAFQCDISHTHLDSIEKGFDPRTGKTVNVTVEVLSKIAKAINVDINLLTNLYLGKEEDYRELGIEGPLFRFKKGIEPYEFDFEDADFLINVYKLHKERNK